MKYIVYWLAAALLISGLYFTLYAAVQQVLRGDANDPQIQMAEDTAARLSAGVPAASLVGDTINVSTSLAPFLIVYNPSGQVLATAARSDARDSRAPALPPGVLQDATPDHENRFTWQPQPGVRLASVMVATPQGYVLAGRSLREVERRERDAERVIGAAWFVSLGVLMMAFVVMRLPIFTARLWATVAPRAASQSQ